MATAVVIATAASISHRGGQFIKDRQVLFTVIALFYRYKVEVPVPHCHAARGEAVGSTSYTKGATSWPLPGSVSFIPGPSVATANLTVSRICTGMYMLLILSYLSGLSAVV